jgi:hypothetical protein
MGYLKDFYQFNLTIRKRYWLKELLTPRNYVYVIRFRKQRANRGYASRDAWGGGEYIAEVAAGILYILGDEKNIVDWDEYFKNNYDENWGYTSLTEVADDLQLYVEWEIIQWDDEYNSLRNEDRWDMDYQVYEQAKNAMHFVADNIGGLWW